jgi:putative ABC transport system substrate-binding protein
MKRRQLLIAAGALAATRLPVLAQSPVAMPRIGLLWIESGADSKILTAFREGLSAQGYTDGKNIRIEKQFLVDRYDRLAGSADSLVKSKVDVVVCYGATAALAASKATSTIPIVMVTGSDPVKLGVVASFSRPGGNVTGVTFLSAELHGKRLEILKEVVPRIRRVGVVFNPESATEVKSFHEWEAAARTLNMEAQRVEIRLQGDIDRVISDASRQRLDALTVAASTMFVANRKQILTAVAKTRLPAIYGSAEDAAAGGLMSYGPNVPDGFRRAAGYVAKILKGAKPADLPFEQPTRFQLTVNLKTAKEIGIAFPQSILLRADQVIEAE